VIAFAQESGDVEQYNIDKWTKSKAENSCLALANVVLPPDAYEAIILRTEAKTIGVIAPEHEGYSIMVVYPYRQTGGCFIVRLGITNEMESYNFSSLAT